MLEVGHVEGHVPESAAEGVPEEHHPFGIKHSPLPHFLLRLEEIIQVEFREVIHHSAIDA